MECRREEGESVCLSVNPIFGNFSSESECVVLRVFFPLVRSARFRSAQNSWFIRVLIVGFQEYDHTYVSQPNGRGILVIPQRTVHSN